ncbi:MAG: hypothetical protein R3B72_01745 [Polyangiaceae bacterium]
MPRGIDTQASTITLRTRAKGLLGKLAHDLEIRVRDFDGEVTVDGEAWTATLTIAVADLEVVGALRGNKVDRAVLSSGDRQEIERKIRQEVLVGPKVAITASGSRRSRGEARIAAPKGEQRVFVDIVAEDRPGGEISCRGDFLLSLKALGVAEIKGPLGAFKVADAVEASFWIMVQP